MEEKKKVKFILKKSSDYRVIPANGVWGGVTPRGDFMLDFFVETTPIPAHVVHEIKPDGGLGAEVEREVEEKKGNTYPITRELVGGVLLSLEQAKSLANFILEKCGDFEKEKKKIDEKRKKG